MSLTKKEKKLLQEQIIVEGFDYAMTEQLSFSDVQDQSLKNVWLDFLTARTKLKKYLEKEGIDLEE